MTEAVVPETVTKEFVEAQAKTFKEELDAEKALRQAAETRLVSLETDAQTRRFNDIIMGRNGDGDGSPPFPGKHEMHNKTLNLIAKEFSEDSDEFREYVSEQRAIAGQMRTAGLFKEVGHGSHGEQAITQVATKAFNDAIAAWQTANPGKDMAAAITAVSAAQPRLYVESVKEKNKVAKAAGSNYGDDDDDGEDS